MFSEFCVAYFAGRSKMISLIFHLLGNRSLTISMIIITMFGKINFLSFELRLQSGFYQFTWAEGGVPKF